MKHKGLTIRLMLSPVLVLLLALVGTLTMGPLVASQAALAAGIDQGLVHRGGRPDQAAVRAGGEFHRGSWDAVCSNQLFRRRWLSRRFLSYRNHRLRSRPDRVLLEVSWSYWSLS